MRQNTQGSTSDVRLRRLAEVVGLCAAVLLTASSAYWAKRHGQFGPALAEVDSLAVMASSGSAGPAEPPGVDAAIIPVTAAATVGVTGGPDDPAGVDPAATPTPASMDDGVITPPDGYARYFDGRPLVRGRTIWMTVTAYSPDHRSCGKWADGFTSSMRSVWTNGMQLAAADPKVLPEGSLISAPGYAGGEVVPVLDVGGAIKGSRLDVLYPSHRQARQWGVQRLPVTVWEFAD